MRTNVSSSLVHPTTHGGSPAAHITTEQELRRTVMACLLWEDGFYENGVSVADRITTLVERLPISTVCLIAVEARNLQHLRHVPLLLCALASRKATTEGDRRAVADAVATVVQRADEMGELISICAKVSGLAPNTCKRSLRGCVRRGIARALTKFGAYQLGKYNSDKAAVKLRDVFRLVHPKPSTPEQSALWKSVVDGSLASPDTWEVALSGGADKKETFTRLLVEGKLGYFALLRNLRNMEQSGVDQKVVAEAIRARKGGAEKILPFRFIAAARACIQQEPALDASLQQCIADLKRLPGRTIILVDVSGSMDAPLSAKSDLKRIDAAAALASVANCENLRVFSFSSHFAEVPPRRGMAGVDAVIRSQPHSSTNLAHALTKLNEIDHDRLIVITDEQSTDGRVPAPKAKLAYMINVGTDKHGVGYGKGWTHIDGFSESVLTYIHAHEQAAQ